MMGTNPYECSIQMLGVELPFDHFLSDESPQYTLAHVPFVSRVLGNQPFE